MATPESYSWELLGSQDARSRDLGARLYQRQVAVIRRLVPLAGTQRLPKPAVPLLDLEVGPALDPDVKWLTDGSAIRDARLLLRPADASSERVLAAGSRLQWQGDLPDRFGEATGLSLWRAQSDGRYYASAFESRWGPEASLADALIAPASAALAVTDAAWRTALVEQLQEVTGAFRREHGLRVGSSDGAGSA